MGIFDEFEDIADPAQLGLEYANEQAAGVKYTDGTKYEVHPRSMLTWARSLPWRGPTVDCAKVHEYYRAKWNDPARTKPKRSIGLALDGPVADQRRWARGLIFVVATSGRVYSHIPKIHRFHHSSLTGSAEVRSAGMWIVENGQLKELGAMSGHYRPNMEQFLAGLLSLKAPIHAARSSLYLWFVPGAAWRTVPFDEWTRLSVRDIFDTYKTNPQEQRFAVPASYRPGGLDDLLYRSQDAYAGQAGPQPIDYRDTPIGQYFR